MKRIKTGIVLFLLFAFLVGCGEAKTLYNQPTRNAIKSTISTLDDLLNYEITVGDAKNKLQVIADSISNSGNTTQDSVALSIKIAISNLSNMELSNKIDAIGTNKSSNLKSEDYDKIREMKKDFEAKLK